MGAWKPEQSWYFEAEDGALSGGFEVAPDGSASNGAFLAPPLGDAEEEPGPARARYVFSIPEAGVFTIWGRIRSPDVYANRFWFQLDQGTWFKWRISVGDIWYWDDFHDDTDYGSPLTFSLSAGSHELVVANCTSGGALDRLRVSALEVEPPPNDTACDPPHSIELDGSCFPSCGSQSQSGTLCGQVACSGRAILDSYDCDICCRAGP